MCNPWTKLTVSSGSSEVRSATSKAPVSVGNVLLHRDVYEEESDKEVMISSKVSETNMLTWKLLAPSLARVKSRSTEGMSLDRATRVSRLMAALKDSVRVTTSSSASSISVGSLPFM